MKPQDNETPDILFEDNHLLCLNKPFGLATQPSLHNEISLEGIAKAYIKNTYNKPGNVFLHAVHRLDKVTSGIVIFAKTSKALSRLNEALRNHEIEKTYVAKVEGVCREPQGVLEHHLVHGEHKAYVSKSKEAKKCRLTYKVVETGASTTTLEIFLVSGRFHLIRAQLAAFGHPIVGDSLYGAKTAFQAGAIALWHTMARFTHPVTGKERRIGITP